jgi:predicted phosphohydrolase
MRIWAIADLHLSFAAPKPMDIFGERWQRHPERIAEEWRRLVARDDLVLLPGDNSWALRFPAALPDLEWIAALPGHKLLTKGNHDYWWDDARKYLRRQQAGQEVGGPVFPASIAFLEAEAVERNGWVLCGTRGWITPGLPTFKPETDQRIYSRELGRLERALASAAARAEGRKPIGVLLHYPPFLPDGTPTAFADMIAAAEASFCVYGHLHRRFDWEHAEQGKRQGVCYHLVSCDYLGFTPSLIVDEDGTIREQSEMG